MSVQFDTSSCISDCSDHALIVATLRGDDGAFTTLVQRYQLPLYNFIRRSLKEAEWSNDVLQFVFLQLYVSLPRLRDNLYSERTREPLKAWLFQVAWNRCIDERRKQRSLLFCELEESGGHDDFSWLDTIPDEDPLPEVVVEQQEMRRLLRKAICHLPPHFRSIVMLRYTQELSFGEIARLLNMPENTAKTYFQRARPLLRSALQQIL
ncbi:RNA polymerase sigma factor [Dictyobacter aurantiacus]|uniref:RNA polymerase sigma factor n=1 Tax=Dictyobacter aurantiacus TaxID=1936993 RepID=A0A401ZG10_9CHLR|nr:sigma-70 family RNA polymerase sigma factor [Dictyobacter aurantiacus]GCE05830.1 hypothetical protein KDAU_31590 [Dictyobacter aurantiacus]